ncbi:MAG: [FeFe] hydrogenase H-cluster radical SAM maturase HydG [Candidatus Marinimicrobia bacterium]|nr:[FeFe] hydrogenase H-cluster radical SAM maturase HydG [Candidatus Neomarinimicrobiota bacterium]MDD5582293.1 [FeFe] hydrogenase H-cluster radical SAM maturase HydG [Candidatus Neomarinimicrobiota bacterium]
MAVKSISSWIDQVIKQEEIDKYLIKGEDFIDEIEIYRHLEENQNPDKKRIRDILQKSLAIKRLNPDETAALIQVKDPEMWEEMFTAGLKVKQKVYDNRIVFFAPLYCSNLCVNSCVYCGFRKDNTHEKRRILTMEEVQEETRAVVTEGHKRMIVVFGEHPLSDAEYMAEAIKNIYKVKVPARQGYGEIRRVNVNAAPMSIDELKKLWEAGIGTYQVFQETYHKKMYKEVHPNGLKANYRWRLYALHRAMDAGIDDVAIGALFGLYDWRFEVMGLLYHTIDLERHFGIGPHTISFPRLTPASGSWLSTHSPWKVDDDTFKKLVTILRLAVPYTGLIITARERADLRREVIKVGCTQTDASTKIGIGGYTEALKVLNTLQNTNQDEDAQQFILGDTRRLDDVIRELAEMGMITSFCTAGYRCGRTGDKIMGLLKSCTEGKFCKLNAVLTFKEYLEDYASPETKAIGEKLLEKELAEIRSIPFFKRGKLLENFETYYQRVASGERDVYI